MTALEIAVRYVLLAAGACFVLGLHLMNHPARARRGNQLSAAGMAAAVAATLVLLVADGTITTTGWIVFLLAAGLGSTAGLVLARRAPMTAMPQLVSLFNAVGGGAAALLAVAELARVGAALPGRASVPAAADIVIGAVTFSGSLIAAGKLHGLVPGRPVAVRGGRIAAAGLTVAAVALGAWLAVRPGETVALTGLLLAALAFGVAMVLPIGGADMPVVISLLNACTGTAVAMAGFALGETGLIIAGALVGASGGILTKLMADAMNRPITAIVIGGFGSGDGPAAVATTGRARAVSADDVAIQLAYAGRVVVVPGYGLAAAQAQHQLAELADVLERHGVSVEYAIHPVAGRMPGHMNVLLAEARVPYPQLKDMDEANPGFAHADVALVVGANDVTNPAARRPGNVISGMPILDVDRAKSIVVIKRSMGHGYAGIDNELYTDPKTGMLFADAKDGLAALTAAVRAYVA